MVVCRLAAPAGGRADLPHQQRLEQPARSRPPRARRGRPRVRARAPCRQPGPRSAAGTGCAGDREHRPGERLDAGLGRRRRGVAALGRRRDAQRRVALLGDADERRPAGRAAGSPPRRRGLRRARTRPRRRARRAAPRRRPPRCRPLPRRGRSPRSRSRHGAKPAAASASSASKIATSEPLLSTAPRPHTAPSATTPSNGGWLPVALGAGRHRHDVVVRHQHDRPARRVAAGPGVDAACARPRPRAVIAACAAG